MSRKKPAAPPVDPTKRALMDLRDFGLPPYLWLLADEITCRALLEGKVTARLHRQAQDALDGLP